MARKIIPARARPPRHGRSMDQVGSVADTAAMESFFSLLQKSVKFEIIRTPPSRPAA